MLIFGYDKFQGPTPIVNGFVGDIENNISPINLGFAGYVMSTDIKDCDIKNIKDLCILRNTTHYEVLKNHYPTLKLEKVSDIYTKYYYIIDVYPHEFWNGGKSNDITISEKALKDIKNNQAKILVLFCTEALRIKSQNILGLLNSWVHKYDLPKRSIVVSCGNHLAVEYFKGSDYITHVPSNRWELSTRDIDNRVEHTKTLINHIVTNGKRDNLFICYNRRAHYHRIRFVKLLYDSDFFERGLVSLGVPQEHELISDIEDEFYGRLPFMIDNLDLTINRANELTTKDYMRTYFSIITETTYENSCVFMSEKIFKPIVSFHPFFVLTGVNFLKYLRKMGYRTFSEWFDESYDKEEDLNKRMTIILSEVERLSKLSDSDLKQMLAEMLPTLKFNHKTFIKRIKSQKYVEKLKEELWK